MAKYNGHRSWNAWNVSLWINNDEGLYTMALNAIRRQGTKDRAARDMQYNLECARVKETPDGAPYTVTSIREAMREM